jgi:hypothetical protein
MEVTNRYLHIKYNGLELSISDRDYFLPILDIMK